MKASSLYLSVILVIIVVIIAHLAWCQWRSRHDKNAKPLYDAAAPPEALAAASGLADALSSMGGASRRFENLGSASGELQPFLAAAQMSSSKLRVALEGFLSQITGSPPTAANLQSVYRRLAGMQGQLQSGADAFTSAAQNIQQAGASGTAIDAELKRMVMGSLASKGKGILPEAGAWSALPDLPALNSIKSTAAAAVAAPASSALKDVGLSLNQVSGAVDALGATLGVKLGAK